MNWHFKKGTHVYTSDGEDVGTVDRVVLDPHTNEISGIVVQQGWLFTEDKVVSVDLIADANDERVTLRQSEHNLNELPEFEETYYVPLNEEDWGAVEASGSPAAGGYADAATPVYGYPPVGTAWWGYGGYFGLPPATPGGYAYASGTDYVERTEQNIPEGTVAVKEGARVLSRDGEHVGDVEEVYVDERTNRATHIVIKQGLLFKERKLIPTNWISYTGEEEVTLTVNVSVVDRLPDYEPVR